MQPLAAEMKARPVSRIAVTDTFETAKILKKRQLAIKKMNKVVSTCKSALLILIATLLATPDLKAQEKLTLDTLECHIIGFSLSPVWGDRLLSYSKGPDGTNYPANTMRGLYKGTYLDFGVNTFYKYKSNWLVSMEGNMWIGDDNLTDRIERMQGVYSSAGIIMALNGVDGQYTCNNRGLSAKVGLGKIFVTDPHNPNSGILGKLAAGWSMSKTVFSQDIHEAPCYQLANNYRNLYDHRRGGLILSESIGYWFMSNNLTMANFYAAFEVSQYWSVSTRDYVIDDLVGLRGPDNHKHFDMTYSIKLCWMFPLKGKTVYDYYYY